MKLSADARVFVDKLHLDPEIDQHLIVCPFHVDSNPSLSISLERGVFFCHGGCRDPRGGRGPEFLIKWSEVVDRKPLTWQQAQRMIARGRARPSAQSLLQEAHEQELKMFAKVGAVVHADRLVSIERAIAALDRIIYSVPEPSDAIWNVYAALYRDHSWCTLVWEVCQSSSFRRRHPLLEPLLVDLKARGEWTSEAFMFGYVQDAKSLKRKKEIRREERCRPQPRPKRTPVSP